LGKSKGWANGRDAESMLLFETLEEDKCARRVNPRLFRKKMGPRKQKKCAAGEAAEGIATFRGSKKPLKLATSITQKA